MKLKIENINRLHSVQGVSISRFLIDEDSDRYVICFMHADWYGFFTLYIKKRITDHKVTMHLQWDDSPKLQNFPGLEVKLEDISTLPKFCEIVDFLCNINMSTIIK